MEDEVRALVPLIKINSSSEILSWTTSSANPSSATSNPSSPSNVANDVVNVAEKKFNTEIT